MAKQLSSFTRAVLDAYGQANDCYREEWGQIAAALRAAADYDPPDHPDAVYDMGWYEGMEFIKSIANELESQ